MARFERNRMNRGNDRDRRSPRDRPRSRNRYEEKPRYPRESNRERRNTTTKVTCSACKSQCEVPFKPTSDKPIYCNSCFSNKGDSRSRPSGRNSQKDLDSINKKLDKIMEALDIN